MTITGFQASSPSMIRIQCFEGSNLEILENESSTHQASFLACKTETISHFGKLNQGRLANTHFFVNILLANLRNCCLLIDSPQKIESSFNINICPKIILFFYSFENNLDIFFLPMLDQPLIV